MVLARETPIGEKTLLTFIEDKVKIHQDVYLDLLIKNFVYWINATFGESGFFSPAGCSHV